MATKALRKLASQKKTKLQKHICVKKISPYVSSYTNKNKIDRMHYFLYCTHI